MQQKSRSLESRNRMSQSTLIWGWSSKARPRPVRATLRSPQAVLKLALKRKTSLRKWSMNQSPLVLKIMHNQSSECSSTLRRIALTFLIRFGHSWALIVVRIVEALQRHRLNRRSRCQKRPLFKVERGLHHLWSRSTRAKSTKSSKRCSMANLMVENHTCSASYA